VKGAKTQTSKKEGKKIKEFRCNREYESCMTKEIPEYSWLQKIVYIIKIKSTEFSYF
jgi:hypothetical protein